MENASKALIIAGAILLAILIISLGIMIFNQAKGVIDGNAMNKVEIESFNQQFTQYEGENVRGSSVRSMCQSVLASNTAADAKDRQVSVNLIDSAKILVSAGTEGDADTNQSTISNLNEIKSGSTYKVECEYSKSGANKGLVNNIKVTKVKTK